MGRINTAILTTSELEEDDAAMIIIPSKAKTKKPTIVPRIDAKKYLKNCHITVYFYFVLVFKTQKYVAKIPILCPLCWKGNEIDERFFNW